MSKNLYELETKEKDKKRGEFNELKFTKNVNLIRTPLLLIVIFGIIAAGIMSALADEGVKLQNIISTVEIISTISLIVYIILTCYLNISFIRWMKIKYNIEY